MRANCGIQFIEPLVRQFVTKLLIVYKDLKKSEAVRHLFNVAGNPCRAEAKNPRWPMDLMLRHADHKILNLT